MIFSIGDWFLKKIAGNYYKALFIWCLLFMAIPPIVFSVSAYMYFSGRSGEIASALLVLGFATLRDAKDEATKILPVLKTTEVTQAERRDERICQSLEIVAHALESGDTKVVIKEKQKGPQPSASEK